jgi:hypothetical protein
MFFNKSENGGGDTTFEQSDRGLSEKHQSF